MIDLDCAHLLYMLWCIFQITLISCTGLKEESHLNKKPVQLLCPLKSKITISNIWKTSVPILLLTWTSIKYSINICTNLTVDMDIKTLNWVKEKYDYTLIISFFFFLKLFIYFYYFNKALIERLERRKRTTEIRRGSHKQLNVSQYHVHVRLTT